VWVRFSISFNFYRLSTRGVAGCLLQHYGECLLPYLDRAVAPRFQAMGPYVFDKADISAIRRHRTVLLEQHRNSTAPYNMYLVTDTDSTSASPPVDGVTSNRMVLLAAAATDDATDLYAPGQHSGVRSFHHPQALPSLSHTPLHSLATS
jgi:hypothetical protein